MSLDSETISIRINEITEDFERFLVLKYPDILDDRFHKEGIKNSDAYDYLRVIEKSCLNNDRRWFYISSTGILFEFSMMKDFYDSGILVVEPGRSTELFMNTPSMK